jgi:hypothetical protein
MNDFKIDAGAKTPHLYSDSEKGTIDISGKSIPENAVEFYRPVFEWLDAYIQQPQPETKVTVQLEYFNTSSSKCLLDIFRRLETLQNSGRGKVTIHWLYEEEDEDMMEAGDDYQTIVKIPFVIRKIEQ